MRTRIRVQARIWDDEPFYWTIAYDVRSNDLLQVGFRDPAVPHSFRIYHYCGPVLALVQAPGLIRANRVADPMLSQLLLERLLQLTLGLRIATPSGMTLRTLVCTNKNVLLKLRHDFRLQQL